MAPLTFDECRISGCCTTVKRGQLAYVRLNIIILDVYTDLAQQIIDLWDGRICSPDGALQILLIIDYIFD
jgi:hypothetical protein